MTKQYRHQWTSSEGGVYEGDNLSENFLSWCEELQDFGDKEWGRVFERIKGDIKDAAKTGEDIWPPSSVAVLAYAEPPMCSQMYKTFDRAKGIEDQTAKAHRKEVGAKECGNILSMFD